MYQGLPRWLESPVVLDGNASGVGWSRQPRCAPAW